MELTTERLTLREFEPDDWQTICAYRTDPAVQQYLLKGQGTEARTRHLVTASIALTQRCPQTFYGFAMVLQAETRLVGLSTLSVRRGVARFGWDLDQRFWNRGYATEATRALLAFAFGTLRVSCARADCFAANTAAVRVLEKVGMRHETSRLRIWFRASHYGEERPVACFSLSVPQWEALTIMPQKSEQR